MATFDAILRPAQRGLSGTTEADARAFMSSLWALFNRQAGRTLKITKLWVQGEDGKGKKLTFDPPVDATLAPRPDQHAKVYSIFMNDVYPERDDGWRIGHWPATLKDGTQGYVQLKSFNMKTGEVDPGSFYEPRAEPRVAPVKEQVIPGRRMIELDGLFGADKNDKELMTIVLAWLVEDVEIVDADVRIDLGERPKTKNVLTPRAAVWLNRGTKSDIAKAQAQRKNMDVTGQVGETQVFTYSTSERDPLKRARADVMAWAKKQKLKPR